jgi:serine/threonine protein kinase
VLLSGTRVAGYVIEDAIGRGGMGVVYAALQPALLRRVALKLLSPELVRDREFLERFRREAIAQAAMDHPHRGVNVRRRKGVNFRPALTL